MRRAVTCLFAMLLASTAVAAEQAPLRLGISRPYDAASTKEAGVMLEGYLSSALKKKVTSRSFDTYEALSTALAKGEIDVAWITPLSYVDAMNQGAVVPIAKALRRKSMFYRACVFVRADSKVATLGDLKNTRAAWVDKGSTSGHLFPKGLLLKSGQSLNGFFASESFVGDHKAACRAVANGEADVGGTFTDSEGTDQKPVGCVDELGEAALSKLRCVAVSDNIPNDVIAGRPGFDEALAGDIGGIFAGLSDTEAGRRILGVFRAEGFGLALDEDFEPIRMVGKAVAQGKWPEAAKPALKADPKAAQKTGKATKAPVTPAKKGK